MKTINDRRSGDSLNWPMIIAYDKSMSYCGLSSDGKSYAAWACKPEYAQNVLKWVNERPEMKHVRIVRPDYRPYRFAHMSIYVVDSNHPSIRGLE